jgi:hypothetical protein
MERIADLAMKRHRPFGVMVIAVMQVIAAPTAGISAVLADVAPNISGLFERYSDAIGTAVGILGLIIAIGLWRLKRWAWVATMLWFGASMAGALLAYWSGEPLYPLMIVSVITVFYLNQRDVQVAFGAAAPAKPREQYEEWHATTVSPAATPHLHE